MNKYFVYVDSKPDGTPFYVGKGTLERVNQKIRRNRHHTNICAKYPEWKRGIAYYGDEVGAFKKEQELIAYFGRDNLCNRTNGGEGTSGHTSWLKGKKLPKHLLDNLIRSNTGRKQSPETIAKRIAKVKAKFADKDHPNKGSSHSDETKAKMSATRTGVKHSAEHKQRISESIKAYWMLRKGLGDGTK